MGFSKRVSNINKDTNLRANSIQRRETEFPAAFYSCNNLRLAGRKGWVKRISASDPESDIRSEGDSF
jgi:hypothetical protein